MTTVGYRVAWSRDTAEHQELLQIADRVRDGIVLTAPQVELSGAYTGSAKIRPR